MVEENERLLPTPEAVEEVREGLLRVTWEPTDQSPSDELERVMMQGDMPVTPTQAQAIERGVERSYLFTKEGLWFGIILPKDEYLSLTGDTIVDLPESAVEENDVDEELEAPEPLQ